jgi:Regulator of chromosome condensation (RCC1) repeat
MLGTADAAFKSTDINPSSGFGASANFYAGALSMWGDSTYGQNGQSLYLPQRVGAATWSKLATGYFQTCGIQNDAWLWCWGDNPFGALGLGDAYDRSAPTKVGSASWASVEAGWGDSCGIQTNQTLWCWGGNDYGSLGVGDTTDRNTPVQVGSGNTWSALAAGGDDGLRHQDQRHAVVLGPQRQRSGRRRQHHPAQRPGAGRRRDHMDQRDRRVQILLRHPLDKHPVVLGQERQRTTGPERQHRRSTPPRSRGPRGPPRSPGTRTPARRRPPARCGAGVTTMTVGSTWATPATGGPRPRSAR